MKDTILITLHALTLALLFFWCAWSGPILWSVARDLELWQARQEGAEYVSSFVRGLYPDGMMISAVPLENAPIEMEVAPNEPIRYVGKAEDLRDGTREESSEH